MVRENALEQGQGRSREIVLFGLFTALIAIGAFIRIPVPVCPFTLQLLFTTLAGLLLGSRKGALSVALYVLLGLVGAVLGQLGDLSFSAIKRECGVKDYGRLLPGHGGVLDRFDSVIFTAPVIYALAITLM